MAFFIAIIAIVPALYAVLPQHRQLDLKLRLNWVDGVVSAIALSIILALEFNDFLVSQGFAFHRPFPKGVSPNNLSELVALLLIFFVLIRLRYVRLSSNRLNDFARLSETLLWSSKYSELLALLADHHDRLFLLAQKSSLLQRISRELAPISPNPFSYFSEEQGKIRDGSFLITVTKHIAKIEILRRPLYSLVRFLELRNRSTRYLQEVINSILLSKSFIRALVQIKPYLGLSLIDSWQIYPSDKFDFVDIYLAEMLTTRNSVLYRELRDNQNMSGIYRYHMSDSNLLLQFFLKDAKRAKEFRVYRGIGEAAIRLLEEAPRYPLGDPYNRAMGNFREDSLYEDPIYAAKHFFEIMVLEALHQDIDWHMWLYYLRDMVDIMSKNYRLSDPESHSVQEFPNRYAYLIYECLTALRGFVLAGDGLTPTKNRSLARSPGEHENNNIIKSSVFALGECMDGILLAENINPEFKQYICEIVFDLYFDLRQAKNLAPYADVLTNKLKRGAKYSDREQIYLALMRDSLLKNQTEYLIKFHHVSDDPFADLSIALFGVNISP